MVATLRAPAVALCAVAASYLLSKPSDTSLGTRGQLLLRRALQDRDHPLDNVMDCRSGWKTRLLEGVFLPISFAMGPVAGDHEIPVLLFETPNCCTADKGRPAF